MINLKVTPLHSPLAQDAKDMQDRFIDVKKSNQSFDGEPASSHFDLRLVLILVCHDLHGLDAIDLILLALLD